MNTLTLTELAARLEAPARPILVEALPARYYDQGHLPAAVNINVGEVRDKAPTLLPDKSAPIVVYCASETCTNSHQVAVQLAALGYGDVQVFAGGKAEWEASGRPFAGMAA